MNLDPSSAARRVNCSGSFLLEQQLPPQEKSPSAIEGDLAHEFAKEILLQNLDRDSVPPTLGRVTTPPDLSDDLLQAIDIYVADVLNITQLAKQKPTIETKIHISDIHNKCYGTPDCWLRWKETIYLWEFKSGHSPVEVFENWQMIEYASGILSLLQKRGEDEPMTFIFRLVQPRCYLKKTPITEWRILTRELDEYFNALCISENLALQPHMPCTTNTECVFCPARHVCSALHSSALTLIDAQMENINSDLNDEKLGYELRNLHYAEKLLKARITALEEQAIFKIKKGQRIPPYVLESATPREKWNGKTEDIELIGEMLGINLLKPKELVTPKQAIKAGMNAELVRSYTELQQGPLKLIQHNEKKVRKIFS